jgi:hypothetical protein
VWYVTVEIQHPAYLEKVVRETLIYDDAKFFHQSLLVSLILGTGPAEFGHDTLDLF